MIASSLVTLALVGQIAVAAVGMLPPTPDSLGNGIQLQPPGGQQVQFDATRFDSVTALSLRSFLDSAVEQGIPIGPLINRALEGSARRKSGVEIMKVVRLWGTALAQAMEALGPGTPVAEIEAGATALRAGIDAKSLVAIRTARSAGTATIPLMVLTDIVQRGIPSTAARDAVSTIARMPGSDKALNGLRETVAKNSVRGPGMAVDALNRYVKGTLAGDNPLSVPASSDRKPIRPPSP